MKKINDFSAIRLYHGSLFCISEFSDEFVGNGTDQLGSGFYFSTNRLLARGHAEADLEKTKKFNIENPSPTLHTIKTTIKNPLDATHIQPLTPAIVRAFMTRSPDLNDALENFGDVSDEGMESVLRRAIPLYCDNDKTSLIRTLNTLSSDFYPESAAEFNRVAKELLGYDGVIEYFSKDANICIWCREDIEIISRKAIVREPDSGMHP
jgi:hypothetical protein